jgi:hypothetical protein
LVVLTYLDVGSYGMVWDDFALFRHLMPAGDLLPWGDVAWRPLPFSDNYFRPLTLRSYYVIAGITDGDPASQHWLNLAIHAANSLMLGLLVARVSPARSVVMGVSVGLLYGLHPALTEPVAWLSGRFDLLVSSSLLVMLAADLGLRSRPYTRVFVVSVAFACGLASKETAVMFPAVLGLWWLATTSGDPLRRSTKNQAAVLTGLLLVTLVWVIVRVSVIGALVVGEQASVDGGVGAQLHAAAASLLSYLRLSLVPFGAVRPLHFDADSLAGSSSWFQIITAVSVVACAAHLALRRVPAALLFCSALIPLIPVLHFHPLNLAGGALVAERYLASPLVLIGLAVAFVPLPVGRRKRLAVSALAVAFGVASLVSVRTTAPRWGSAVTLWEWAEERAPRSVLPPINLAKTYYEAERYEDALDAASRALWIEPEHPFAANNGCASLIELSRPLEAVAWCQIGLDSGRASPSQWVNLMRAQLSSGQPESAIETHRRAASTWGLRTERMEALRQQAIDLRGEPVEPSDLE